MPTVLLISTPFVGLVQNQARALGMPSVPTVVLPHPIAGMPLETVFRKIDAALEEIIAKLSTPVAPVLETKAPSERVDIDVSDEWPDLQRELSERGWSDGLPVIPPIESRVAAMVAGAGGAPANHVVGVITPKMGMATVEKIAVNAVMAGCRPEHMPVLIAAIQALTDPSVSLKNMLVSTHPVTPLSILGGPLTRKLNVNSGSGLFGPGPWANGVIGRALQLMMLNIGGSTPVEISKATMSHPGRYTYCIAENEAASPWPSLRADRGFSPEVSTVTVIGAEAPHNINDHESTTAGGLLTMISGTMAQTGQNSGYYAGEVLLLLGPEHAATIAADGYSKDDVKRAVYEQARISMSRYSQENIERRLWRFLPKRYRNRPLETMVTMVQRWEDVTVIVAGGAGKHSMYLPTNGKTRSVTRPILKFDGSPWLPSDF